MVAQDLLHGQFMPAVRWNTSTCTTPICIHLRLTSPVDGNQGHEFTDVLTDPERKAIIEYLKTL